MLDQTAVDLSNYRMEKAQDLLSQAQLLYEAQKYDGSINRSYYAIFNTIRSLLALMRLDSSKHSAELLILLLIQDRIMTMRIFICRQKMKHLTS